MIAKAQTRDAFVAALRRKAPTKKRAMDMASARMRASDYYKAMSLNDPGHAKHVMLKVRARAAAEWVANNRRREAEWQAAWEGELLSRASEPKATGRRVAQPPALNRAALAPTSQRAEKAVAAGGDVDEPVSSRNVRRIHFRIVSPLQKMLGAEEIDHAQFQAGEKFQRHYEGYLGSDVRTGNMTSERVDTSEMADDPRHHHGLMVTAARLDLTPAMYGGLVQFLVEGQTLVDVGRTWKAFSDRHGARTAGASLVTLTLDRLVILWERISNDGAKCHVRQRRRA